MQSQRRPIENKDVLLTEEIVIGPSPLSQLGKIVLFFITLTLTIYLAREYPSTVEHVNLGAYFDENFTVALPLLGLVPLLLLVIIAHNLFNNKYILSDDYVLEVSGILSLTSRTVRIQYQNIKTLEIEKNLIHRFIGVGNVVIAAEMTRANSEIVMRGVSDPHRWKHIIHLRMKAKQHEYAGHARPLHRAVHA